MHRSEGSVHAIPQDRDSTDIVESRIVLSQGMLALQRAFNRAKKDAKRAYRLQQAHDMARVFFENPRYFWTGYRKKCELNDVDKWTDHVKHLLSKGQDRPGHELSMVFMIFVILLMAPR